MQSPGENREASGDFTRFHLMTTPSEHLIAIELSLIASPVLAEYTVVRSWAEVDDGYIRIRATLINGDFLEAAEYFVQRQSRFEIADYRHQWMDSVKRNLRRRWDCTPDHPHLPNFPHHVHIGSEENLSASKPVGLIDLLSLLEELLPRG